MRYIRQFLLFSFLLVICGFLLYSAYMEIELKTIEQVNNEQTVHASQAAVGIERFFTSNNEFLSFLAGNSHIIHLDPDGRQLMRDFFNSHEGEILSITRVDENGIISYTYPVESSTGANISSQSHVHQLMSTHSVVISDVFTSVQGFRTIAFHMPVIQNGTFKGSIAILIPFDTLAKEYLANIRVLDTGYAWTINRNGTVIYSPYPEQIGKPVFDVYNSSPSVTAMVQKAMKGSRGEAAYIVSEDPLRNLPSRKFQAIYIPVTFGDTSWSIIVSTPEQEILSMIQDFRNTLIIISAILIISLLFFTYYLARARGIVKEEEIRRKAEDALRESEEFNRGLVENLPDIIMIYDRNGIIRFANKPAMNILSSPTSKVIGDPIYTFVPEYQRDDFEQRMRSRLSGERLPPYEVDIRTGNGAIITTFLQGVPISYKNEPVVLVLVVDITDRKLAEQKLLEAHRNLEKKVAERTRELSEANLHLQELDKLKSSFLATMSHELRTPLNSIIGFTGIILQGLAGPLNSEQTKQLGLVQSSSRHLLALINDILDISKIEAGELNIVSEPVDIQNSVESVIHLMEPIAKSKGLIIETDFMSDPVTISGDQRRIEQIIMNLMSNAVKFTEQGTIYVKTRVRDGTVILSVKDTGIGIPAEEFDTLFQPFHQIDTGTTRKHDGTGLGLSISKKLVELHGGTISVQSVPGTGSEFTVSLPVGTTTADEDDCSGN